MAPYIFPKNQGINTNLDTITDIAFTSSKFTYARNELHKNNRTVYMSFNNHVSSLNSGDILATLPTSCIPCNGSWKIPLYDTNSELLGTLECYDNGNIKYNGNSITTERWIIATASWLTAN